MSESQKKCRKITEDDYVIYTKVSIKKSAQELLYYYFKILNSDI